MEILLVVSLSHLHFNRFPSLFLLLFYYFKKKREIELVRERESGREDFGFFLMLRFPWKLRRDQDWFQWNSFFQLPILQILRFRIQFFLKQKKTHSGRERGDSGKRVRKKRSDVTLLSHLQLRKTSHFHFSDFSRWFKLSQQQASLLQLVKQIILPVGKWSERIDTSKTLLESDTEDREREREKRVWEGERERRVREGESGLSWM